MSNEFRETTNFSSSFVVSLNSLDILKEHVRASLAHASGYHGRLSLR